MLERFLQCQDDFGQQIWDQLKTRKGPRGWGPNTTKKGQTMHIPTGKEISGAVGESIPFQAQDKVGWYSAKVVVGNKPKRHEMDLMEVAIQVLVERAFKMSCKVKVVSSPNPSMRNAVIELCELCEMMGAIKARMGSKPKREKVTHAIKIQVVFNWAR